MNRRTDFDGDGSPDANQGNSLSTSGVLRLDTVVPFSRKTSAALDGLAAGGDPLSSPAIPLGSAVQAVVMRLANKRIRLRVSGPDREDSLDRS